MKREIKYKNYACIDKDTYFKVRENLENYLTKSGKKNVNNYASIFNRFLKHLDKHGIFFKHFTQADMEKFSASSKRARGSFRSIREYLIKERYVITDKYLSQNSAAGNKFSFYVNEYLTAKERGGLRKSSIECYRKTLKKAAEFFEQNQTGALNEISRDIIEKYINELLVKKKKRSDRPMKINSVREKIHLINSYFSYLVNEGYLNYNPAALIKPPKKEKIIHSNYLSVEEMKKLFAVTAEDTVYGGRDNMLFKLAYACGLRVTEVINVKCSDLLFETGMLKVREAKGGIERAVPLLKYMQTALEAYIKQNRIQENDYLFYSRKNKVIGTAGAKWALYKYLAKTGVKKKLSFHLFRHSAGKHLLERGLGIRYVQKFLGHRSINSTAVYTKLTIENLKQAVKAYHPRETGKAEFYGKTGFKSR